MIIVFEQFTQKNFNVTRDHTISHVSYLCWLLPIILFGIKCQNNYSNLYMYWLHYLMEHDNVKVLKFSLACHICLISSQWKFPFFLFVGGLMSLEVSSNKAMVCKGTCKDIVSKNSLLHSCTRLMKVYQLVVVWL